MSSAAASGAQPPLTPLPAGFRPDWNRDRSVILRQGLPDWVPFMEAGLDRTHKARVLGRPVRSLADDWEVSRRVGQSFVVISIGLHSSRALLDAMMTTEVGALAEDEATMGWAHGTRHWAHGKEGVIRDEAEFEAFPWPDPDQFDMSVLDEADRLLPAEYKVVFAVGKVFNLAWWLMGFDAFSYALADQPALIERLYAKIAQIQSRTVERALEHKSVGLVWHADDMAYKTGLMVKPALLRRHIFPVYQRLNAVCHQRDVPCVFHSDGDMSAAMEDIIAAGFDAYNPIEPLAMDIRALKARVAGRLTLIGNVDLAYTLTRGTPEEVEAEVRGLIRDLAPAGGYGLASANSVPEYVPWRNFVAMHAAWLKYGRYPIKA